MPTVTDNDQQKREAQTSERGRYAHLFSEYFHDEQLVMDFLNSKGCSVSRLDTENRRNPDFMIYFANGSVAICEVKSFGGVETGDSDYNLPFDPYHRISNALYTGIAQLIEYKHAPEAFRILFFVNHNETLRFDSLVKLLDGEWDPLRKQFLDKPNEATRAARSKRRTVDLYLWLRNTAQSSSEFPSQHWGSLERIDEICAAMQLNPGRISLIQAA
jgi:hypothetical protein